MIKYLISLRLFIMLGCLGCFSQGKISRPNKPHNSNPTHNRQDEVVSYQLEFVDLGLPSKTMWTNKNEGANKNTDKGSNETWAQANLLTGESGVIFVSGRIPSKDEFNELRKLCQWQWTSNGDTSGHRVIGPNGNSIYKIP